MQNQFQEFIVKIMGEYLNLKQRLKLHDQYLENPKESECLLLKDFQEGKNQKFSLRAYNNNDYCVLNDYPKLSNVECLAAIALDMFDRKSIYAVYNMKQIKQITDKVKCSYPEIHYWSIVKT